MSRVWMRRAAVGALMLVATSVARTQEIFTTSPVRLDTPTGTLNGTLERPALVRAVPLVVIISGSGPTDRDGNSLGLSGPNNSLRLLAEGLAARGIASVRYDKRGVANSAKAAKSESDLRFEMYADDAAAWVKKYRGDPRFGPIVVLGHSEGSLLGMLAVQRAAADGFVSIAGIARPAQAVLHDQLKAGLPEAMLVEADKVLALLSAGKTAESLPSGPLAQLFRPSVQPYLISWFKWDPAVEIAKLKVPVLIAQGTTDIQVAVGEADELKGACPTATLLKIEGMNHVLKHVGAEQAAQIKSYTDPELEVERALIDGIADFVKGIRTS